MGQKLQVSNNWRKWSAKLTWYDVLVRAARECPQREALVIGDTRVNYEQYLEKVNQVAKGLSAIGIKKGDHVAIWMTNHPEWCYLRYALNKLGARFIPINTRYRGPDLEYVLAHSDSKALVMEDKFLGKINAMGTWQELCPELATSGRGQLKSAKFPRLESVVCLGERQYPGCFSWQELVELGRGVSDADVQIKVVPDDISHIMYTSGTTGVPKGAMIHYRMNVASFTLATEPKFWNLQEGDRLLNLAPFFGNMGFAHMSMCPLRKATLVSTYIFDPEETLTIIEREKITHTLLVPTMIVMLLEHPDLARYDLSSLKAVMSGGAYIPRKLIVDFMQTTGVKGFVPVYGLVEASGIVTHVLFGDTLEHVEKTVGFPLPNAELAILDLATGQPLPPGQEGEICTREAMPGSQHMRGYYKMPEKTAETIKDGWLHSGDLGKLWEDGYVEFTGRVKELVVVGGLKVAPAEVEESMLKHPKIQDVAVVAVPDKRLGEVPAAFVRLKSGQTTTAEEIIKFCKDSMTNIKVPRYVFFVEQYPLTAQGKVQKFKLTETAIKELGLTAD